MAPQAITFPIDPVVKTHLVINCVLVFIAIFTVGLRLFARFATGAKLWWDDYLIILSMPQGIGMLIIQGLYAPMGVGRPMTETLPNLVAILKLTISYALIYAACTSTVKLSILFFYLRVFPNKKMRIATQVVIGFVVVWAVANVIIFLLTCRPLEKSYNPTVEGSCGNKVSLYVACGVYNIISDLIVLTLPLRTIWALNTKKQMKISLTAIFSAGLLVSAVTVSRVVALARLDMANFTGTTVWADFLSTVEANLGIICVSMPMLAPLVAKYHKARGVSKLEKCGQPKQSGQTSFRISSRKKRPGLDTMALQSIYDHATETNHAATVFATQSSSQDGSETHLSPHQHESPGPGRPRKGAIIVERKWEVHRS